MEKTRPDYHKDIKLSMKELGFQMIVPHIKRGENHGSFWLFGKEVEEYEKMMSKKKKLKIKTDIAVYNIQADISKDHKSAYCEFEIKNV